jgi:L-rhamnose isomerase / sugar isomerase
MTTSEPFRIPQERIAELNARLLPALEEDYAHLGRQLARRSIDIEALTGRAQELAVALPSWGVGTGGTRFARFPGAGEPRNVYEKLDDCATVHQLVHIAPRVSLHLPWDKPDDPRALADYARARGLGFDAVNSNTFQDHAEVKLSYKFGSLTHTDPAVRRQAIAHNIECIETGVTLGSKAITVWIADGGNFPGQQHLRRALDRYLESLREIYGALPADWKLFVEHKLYEPAFYSTVINDWGTSYHVVSELGPQALSLVDLGHHAPSTNIEMVVARLIGLGKLGGFHFNDSSYGDDDLDTGSVNPFRLFLVFNELVDAMIEDGSFAPAYMLDQSHNVTDPIESLASSAVEVQRAYVQAWLVDRTGLGEAQKANDALAALGALKAAFNTDVAPILAMARHRAGGAIDPVAVYRASGYRAAKGRERPQVKRGGSGIV